MGGKWLKLGHKVLGSGAKLGTVGVGIFITVNATTSDDRVLSDFQEGKAVRGSLKVAAGTAIDMVKHFDAIDGAIAGEALGPWGDLAGALIGGGNTITLNQMYLKELIGLLIWGRRPGTQ